MFISLFIFAIELVISLPAPSKISITLAQPLFGDVPTTHDGGAISTVKLAELERPSSNLLIEYTLGKINDERSRLHLPLLKLSENKAAQIHAEELLSTKSGEPSHISTNGMKPYMTYSLYGGRGYVEQNLAISGYDTKASINCKALRCDKLNPYEQISKIQWSMMYNDSKCCHDRHRLNILDNHHTHVGIGVAYNDYYFALVENFENKYVKLNESITQDNRLINFVGRVEPPSNNIYSIDTIAIYYDPTPTPLLYEQNKNSKSYSLGNLSALVVKPAPLFYQYQKPANYKLIEANTWHDDNQTVEIRFDLSSLISKRGVYTIVTYLKDPKTDRFPAMSYSVFV